MRYLLDHLLRSAADRYPERPALMDGPRVLTYAALEERANRLARLLTDELGVRARDRVGIYLQKSADSIVAMYGALKAGAAYVPLDAATPVSRLAYILRDCDIRCLLTGLEKGAACGELAREAPRLSGLVVLNAPAHASAAPAGLRVHGADDIDAQAPHAPAGRVLSADLAYVLYTSGSTGRPKGVMLTHRNALAFVEWAAERFQVSPEDRLSNHAPLHFDLSVFDVFAACRGGAATVLVPPGRSMLPADVAQLIERQAITVWYSVPSILGMLAQHGGLATGCFPRLRDVLFAGEVFPARHLRRLMTLLPHVRFHNLYGPTETNVCTHHHVAAVPGESESIPIGRAIADVEVTVVGQDGRPTPVGEVGELCVRGATVTHGYWGDGERSARSFLSVSSAGPDVGLYRTGDLARRDADGNHWFLGRVDDQVKCRGYRIALGDVEAAVLEHPLVSECIVVPVPDDLVGSRLFAFVVTSRAVTGAELARFCGDRVPRYMVPERFELRAALPRTPSGKFDRRALLEEGKECWLVAH